MPPGQYRGCGRGVFALSSWKTPLRRPACIQEVKKELAADWKQGQSLMMKYKYQANEGSPLGKELTVKQKESVQFVSRHDDHWILVRNEAGESGFIPSGYVMASPDSVKSLPWLDQRSEAEKIKQKIAEWKPYKSAYSPKSSDTLTEAESLSHITARCARSSLMDQYRFLLTTTAGRTRTRLRSRRAIMID